MEHLWSTQPQRSTHLVRPPSAELIRARVARAAADSNNDWRRGCLAAGSRFATVTPRGSKPGRSRSIAEKLRINNPALINKTTDKATSNVTSAARERL